MLSLSRVSSASGASNYYEQEDNYYFLGEATTSWFGKGAESLGLTGQVNRDDFKRVLEGNLPNGESLEHIVNGENKHRPGYDLTFSAPKSVSVLALVVGEKAVLDAHNRAVKYALTEIEKSASTRVMKNGIVSIEETGNITASLFLHDTNRNLEPALHTHAILSNITETKEGSWKTLSTDKSMESNAFVETIWKNAVAFGALYRQHLKPDLLSQGYELKDVGKHGQFEIVGVPTEMYSSRGKEIIEAVGKDASAKEKSVAAKDTRKKKDFTNIEEVREGWKKQLAETGFDIEKIRNNEIKIEIGRGNTSDLDIKDTVKSVIKNLGNENVKFTYDKLLTQVINSISIEKFEGVNNLKSAINQEIQQGNLVPLKSSGELFTTIGHLKNETNVVKAINKLNTEKLHLVSNESSSLTNYLVSEQSKFKSISISGGNDFIFKSLGEISNLAVDNDKKNIIIVPDNKTKNFFNEKLSNAGDIYTLKEVAETDSEKFNNAIVTMYKTENAHLDSIHEILKKSKDDKTLIISLDTKTKNSEGIFIEVLNKSNNDTFNLYESNENKKVYFVSEIDKSDRLNLAAKQYINLTVNNKDAIVQVHDIKSKKIATNAIRESLISNGLLSKESIFIKNERQVFLSDSNRNLRNTYSKGLILDNVKEKERYRIIDVDKKSNQLKLVNELGEKSFIDIKNIDKNYNLIEESKLELRVGDKLKTNQRFDQFKGNGEFTVAAIKKGNFLFSDKVLIEDADGKKMSFSTKKTGGFDYNYSETFGASLNNERTVIAVLNKDDVSGVTLNKIKRSGNAVIAITGLNKKTSESKIKNIDVGISHIPKNTGNILDTISTINALKKDVVSDFDKIIELSIDKSSGGKVFFNASAVIMNASNLDEKLSIEKISNAINIRIENGDIIPITTSSLTDNFVKKEVFNNEINIVKKIFEGKNKAEPLLRDTSALERTSLTKGQKAASELLLTSKDTIIAIQGYAGVGKTTQFRTVAEAIKTTRPDIQLRGLAPTHKAVSELKSVGMEAQTIASFTQELSLSKTIDDYKKTVFVIDESSMTGNKGLSHLIDSITSRGGRVILSGDKDQLKSFESGAPFKLTLERSSIDHVVMDEIVRQIPELKPAVEAIIKGKVNESLSVIEKVQPNSVPRMNNDHTPESSIIDLKGKDASEKIEMISQDFANRTPDARNETFIITPLNADRNAINEKIHQILVDNNQIKVGKTIKVLERVNSQEYDLKSNQFWSDNKGNIAKIGDNYFKIESINKEGIISLVNLDTKKESSLSTLEVNPISVSVHREKEIEVSVGEKIRITVTDMERNAFNNDMGVIKNFSEEKIIMDFNGREIIFNPEKRSDQHLDYSYAITSYSSQGASIPYEIVYDGAEGNKRNLAALDNTYVELSRSKAHVQLYIDDLEKWEKHIERNTGERATAHDVLHYTDNQKANKSLQNWNESADISGKLAEKLPDNLQGIAKYSSKNQEILLPVYDDFGVQRGNYHIPVGIFSGNLDYQLAHYEGAMDGNIIVLNKGDSELETIVYEKNDIDKAINIEPTENNTIVIKLDELEKNPVEEIPLTKEDIKLQEAIDELTQLKSDKEIAMPINEEKELLIDNIINIKDEITAELALEPEHEAKVEEKRIRLDEENIIQHKPEKLADKDLNI